MMLVRKANDGEHHLNGKSRGLGLRYLVSFLLISGIYFCTAWLGLNIHAVNRFVTLIWPPTGISLAALYLLGYRLWPAITSGAFLVNFVFGAPPAVAFGMAIGNTLEALLGAYLLRKSKFHSGLERTQDILKLVVLAAISTFVSGLVGISSLHFGGLIVDGYRGTFVAWWLGNMMGDLIVAPPLLVSWSHFSRRSGIRVSAMRYVEALILTLLVLIICGSTYKTLSFLELIELQHPYFIFPMLIWTAMRFGQVGSVWLTFFVTGMAVWGTAIGSGPFIGGTVTESLIRVQTFMSMVALTSLTLSAAVAEREQRRKMHQRAEKELKRSQDELEHKVKQRTEDLSRSRELLMKAERLAKLGCWEWDILTNKIQWSEELYRIYGLEPRQLDGTLEKFLSFVHPADREKVTQAVQNARATHEDFSLQERIVRSDQSVRVLHSYGKVIIDDSGNPVRMYGACQDITEYKLLWDEFEKTEQRFRAMVEAVKEYAVFAVDPNGYIETWNEGAKRIKGYEDIEVLGRHFSIFYTPEDRKAGKPTENLRIAAEQGGYECEGWRLRKDGSRVWAHIVLTPIKNNEGILVGFSKVTQDRTKWRDADLKIRAAEAKFRGLLESAPDAIVIVNEKGQIEFVNEQTESLFGYHRDELLSKALEILLPERFRTAHVIHREKYTAHPITRPMGKGLKLFGRKKDGTEFPIDVSLSPLKTERGVLISGAIRDITERHAAEEERELLLKREQEARADAEKAARMRDEMIAIVSHDLKNPLTSILTGANLLRNMEWISDTRGRRQLELMELSANDMNRMIRDLLGAYKAEVGGYKFVVAQDHENYPVFPLVKEAVELQQTIATAKNIKIDFEVQEGLPLISINKGLIGQVFQNLIGNAIKFTSAGGSVWVKAKSENTHVVFSIEDTGPGIDEKFIPTVFNRFTQAKRTARLGTGLGLVIAKGIIEAHNGKIWVKSKLGVGTTFFFSIPAISY